MTKFNPDPLACKVWSRFMYHSAGYKVIDTPELRATEKAFHKAEIAFRDAIEAQFGADNEDYNWANYTSFTHLYNEETRAKYDAFVAARQPYLDAFNAEPITDGTLVSHKPDLFETAIKTGLIQVKK